jgi:hypothetical protein
MSQDEAKNRELDSLHERVIAYRIDWLTDAAESKLAEQFSRRLGRLEQSLSSEFRQRALDSRSFSGESYEYYLTQVRRAATALLQVCGE